MNNPEAFITLVLELQRQARVARQRRLLLLSGDADWCRAMAGTCLETLPERQALRVGDAPPCGVPRLTLAEGQQVLGQELDLLVLDAHECFDRDVFGASSGALVGGGL
ncbi:MAG TPA: hypothetical protein VLA26_09210, partial [Gammaproteobacteria bacterium]|nr:hypothetical protein [Gammaproteobacteria bacterium]